MKSKTFVSNNERWWYILLILLIISEFVFDRYGSSLSLWTSVYVIRALQVLYLAFGVVSLLSARDLWCEYVQRKKQRAEEAQTGGQR